MFLQRFDEVWGERVDVDDMEQILNKDKLFLLDACAPPVTVAVTVSRDAGMKVGQRGGNGLMNYIYKVVDVNPQISKPRNSYNAEIKNLYAVVTISLQIVDNKWFTMLRRYGSVHIYTFIK